MSSFSFAILAIFSSTRSLHFDGHLGFQEGTNNQQRQADIATFSLNRPRGRFSENVMRKFENIVYSKIRILVRRHSVRLFLWLPECQSTVSFLFARQPSPVKLLARWGWRRKSDIAWQTWEIRDRLGINLPLLIIVYFKAHLPHLNFFWLFITDFSLI